AIHEHVSQAVADRSPAELEVAWSFTLSAPLLERDPCDAEDLGDLVWIESTLKVERAQFRRNGWLHMPNLPKPTQNSTATPRRARGRCGVSVQRVCASKVGACGGRLPPPCCAAWQSHMQRQRSASQTRRALVL